MDNDLNKVLVSVCIANYNGSKVILACLESVFAQICDFNFEVIVHDDASQDDSIELVEAFSSDIKIIKSEVNVGFCISNNKMTAEAKGEYILLLNNDTELFPDSLSTLVSLYVSSGCGVLTLPQYRILDNENDVIFDRGMFLDCFMNSSPNMSMDDSEVHAVMGALLFIRKELWNKMGGFPEWFGSLAEDLYICLYAHVLSEKVLVSETSGYRHVVGHSFGGGKSKNGKLSTVLKRRILSERNKTFCICIFFPWYSLVPILTVHFLFLLFEGVVLSISNKDINLFFKVYLNVIREVFLKRKLILLYRKKVQTLEPARGVLIKTLKFFPYKLIALVKFGLPKINH